MISDPPTMNRVLLVALAAGCAALLGCEAGSKPAGTEPIGQQTDDPTTLPQAPVGECDCFNGAFPACASRVRAHETAGNCAVAVAADNDRDLFICADGIWSQAQACTQGSCLESSDTSADACPMIGDPPVALCPFGNGLYCGETLGRDPKTLYDCQNGAITVNQQCGGSCVIMPPGQADICACASSTAQCVCPSGNGAYCGNDGLGLNPNTLYNCANGVVSTVEVCQYGCHIAPPFTADSCNGAGTAAPTNLHAAPGSGWAEIRWSPAYTPASYTITASPGGATMTAPGSATGARFTGLTNGITYTFTVKPNDGDPSIPSNSVTPTTDSNIIVDVPHYRQRRSLTCEEASLSMALVHAGINKTEEEILTDIGVDSRAGYVDEQGRLRWGDPYSTYVGDASGSEGNFTGYGTYYPTIDRVARSYGAIVLFAGENSTASQLYGQILAGHPAEVWITYDWTYHAKVRDWVTFDGSRTLDWRGPYEHAVVMVGVTHDSVIIDNPTAGSEWQWVLKSTFESAWSTYNNMAVILE